MPPAHRNTSRAAERRRQRRQRRSGEDMPLRASRSPRMAPLQLDPRKSTPTTVSVPTSRMESETEYAIVRRDLWRLTVFSVLCFVLMIGILMVVNA
jgi:hypothetical protein